jgi:hypothetical protein
MIHYQLQCTDGHGFDGWFKDSQSFEQQAKRGLLSCPICGATQVERALMTPSVPRKGNTRTEVVAAPAPERPAAPADARPPTSASTSASTSAPAAVAGRMPDHMRAMLQRLRSEVERNCDYVGNGFADEARRIHRGESDRRGIYGEASSAETEALADEGIEVARIPWVPRADG